MPVKRIPKTNVPETAELTPEQIEAFGNQADQSAEKSTRLDPDAKPTIGINVKFNEYEHELLKKVAHEEGRSLQKQIKFMLMRGLKEKRDGNTT